MSERNSAAPDESILNRVRYPPSGFNPVEARIAAAILEDPGFVARESILSLAQRTAVSTGSISVSGKTRPVVDAAARASAAGATVVALCGSSRAPLLRSAGLSLVIDAQRGKFQEPPIRTAMLAVSRALVQDVSEQMPQDEVPRRRSTWSSGRFGLRYE